MRQRGLITVCVLSCLAITVSIVMSLMQMTLRARREVATRHQVHQTDWLLDAGIKLANSRLSDSETYEGETWRLEDTIPGYYAAQVVIAIERDAEIEKIQVTAKLSNSSLRGAATRGLTTQRSQKWQLTD